MFAVCIIFSILHIELLLHYFGFIRIKENVKNSQAFGQGFGCCFKQVCLFLSILFFIVGGIVFWMSAKKDVRGIR